MKNLNLSLQHYLIIGLLVLLAATGILGYSLMQEMERSDALEAANEIYEADFQALQKQNLELIDSLEVVQQERAEVISNSDQKIKDALTLVDQILKTSPNEKAIDNLHDADSIAELFARYYPDHSGAGQGSD